MNKDVKNIAIFASGSGTNAENIAQYFAHDKRVKVALIISGSADAFVLERAKKLCISSLVLSREAFYASGVLIGQLREYRIGLIVLAGFLWLIPGDLIRAFPGRIINLHPALLPKFGGKGMYGKRVHQAVIDAGEKQSGITIHIVNERYDEGKIIFQATCRVSDKDTAATLAEKVHELEYLHYPAVIERILFDPLIS